MPEVLVYGLALVVTCKFAWDYLIFPVIDNVMAIINHLNADDMGPPEETYAVGFQPPYYEDDDEDDDE